MSSKPLWRRKRILWPLFLLVALVAAGGIAIVRSRDTRIILYNQTGAPLGPVRLRACGQSITVLQLEDEASYRWRLEPHGGESEIVIEAATKPPLEWRGGYVEPRGGYRVTLRIWPDNQVEDHTQISVWQRWIEDRPAPPE